MTPLTTCRWLLLLLATALTATGANTCPPKHWFSSLLDACVPCAACSAPERPIILRPCQPHQDTVCGTLNDLEFEWNLLHSHQTPTADGEATLSASASSSPTNASPPMMGGTTWDWQPSSMAFAAVACVLFVVALAYILYQHAKQWRHMENMERRFDRGERADFRVCVYACACEADAADISACVNVYVFARLRRPSGFLR